MRPMRKLKRLVSISDIYDSPLFCITYVVLTYFSSSTNERNGTHQFHLKPLIASLCACAHFLDRKLALKWHPDRHSNSTEEEKTKAEATFRDVNLAYEVLSDPVKKQRYDEGVEEQDLDNPHAQPGGMHSHGGGMGGMGGIDPDLLFQMFMQQQHGGMGGGSRRGGMPGGFHFG